jgi:hypothetical protein
VITVAVVLVLGGLVLFAPGAVWLATRIGYLPPLDEDVPVTYPDTELQREEVPR